MDLGRLGAEAERLRELRFDALGPESQMELLHAAWNAAFVSPADAMNPTGLWLLPHELSRDVYSTTRIYEYFGDLVGAHIYNPARQFGHSIPNPALEVANNAGIDLMAELQLLADTIAGSPESAEIENRLHGLVPRFRAQLAVSSELSDEDLLHALCQPEIPIAVSPALGGLPEGEQIAMMRSRLQPHLATCCSNKDLLEAARNPHSPLFASGLCQVQALHGHARVPLSAGLRFSAQALERERVEACFWYDCWPNHGTSSAHELAVVVTAA